ncbi:MAG: hypothetical protein ACTSW1_07220 [Candidatus Hodarchaeales archaeon]
MTRVKSHRRKTKTGRTVRVKSYKRRSARATRLDKKRKALHPGRRVSKTGRRYTENRINRSDRDRRKRL